MIIRELTLVSSADCNLQCEYCQLQRNKDETAHTLQKNTIQAFKDGTFLKNIKQIYSRLKINPSKTVSLSLWGQEPTLTLDTFYSRLNEWLEFLPNIETITFSTNGIAFIDKIITFVSLLEQYSTHEIKFYIQFSYDGEYSTNNIRKTKDDIIINNVKTFIKAINTLPLNNIKVFINFNAVVSLYLINNLNTSDKVKDYYDSIYLIANECSNLIKNENLYFSGVQNRFEFPIMATSDDGEHAATFMKRALRIAQKNNIILNALQLREDVYKYLDNKSLDEWAELVLNDKKHLNEFFKFLNNTPYGCGTLYNNLKLMYNGTALNCQTHLFDLNKQFLYGDEPVEISSKEALINSGHYINLITASQEELDKIFYVYKTFCYYTCPTLVEHYMIMLKYLAIAGQIDKKYLINKKLLLKHILLLLLKSCCPYAQQLKTGSLFLLHSGFFRFYFNGIADIIEEEFNNDILARR